MKSPGARRPCLLTRWPGGKVRQANQLIGLLPEQHCYVEVFGGMGSVLLNKPAAKVEIYNDIDGRLVSLFRVLKYHYLELDRELDWLLRSRQMFDDFREQQGLTEIQRAARFLFLVSTSFASKGLIFSRASASNKSGTALTIPVLRERARSVSARLERVSIEQLDWLDCLQKFDGPGTVFFIDPPYTGSHNWYQYELSDRSHDKLAEALRQIKGKFLLTDADKPAVRERYRGFQMQSITTRFTASNVGLTHFKELIVTNYGSQEGRLKTHSWSHQRPFNGPRTARPGHAEAGTRRRLKTSRRQTARRSEQVVKQQPVER